MSMSHSHRVCVAGILMVSNVKVFLREVVSGSGIKYGPATRYGFLGVEIRVPGCVAMVTAPLLTPPLIKGTQAVGGEAPA